MSFTLKPSQLLLEQIEELSAETARTLESKLQLLKLNPYHYKRIHGHNLSLFRILFSDNQKEKRVIYLVDKPYVKILFILDRDNDYKDLKKYLKKVRY